MDPFELPEELPTGTEELNALRDKAQAAFDRLRGKVDAGETLSNDELAELRSVVAGRKVIDSALSAASATADEIADLIAEGSQPVEEPEGEGEPEEESETEEETEAPADDPDAKSVVAAAPKAPARQKTSFSGTGKGKSTAVPRGTNSLDGVGFRMYPSMIGHSNEPVGYRQLAESIDAVKKGHRPRGDVRVSGGY